METTATTIITLAERPDLVDAAQYLADAAWPEFMMHDRLVNRYWMRLYEEFPEYQFVLMDDQSERVLAMGNTVPLACADDVSSLPDGGVDWILTEAFEKSTASAHDGHCQFALQIVVDPGLRGRALSGAAVRAMIAIGKQQDCASLYAPVRPNQKHLYPLTPMERYIEWTNDDGLPFDAWMRVHARLGARTLGVCHESMRIEGTVGQWEDWIGMRLPDSGEYVIPLALVPIRIDRHRDEGLYIEPNVWMQHSLD
ncbi:GNAT family N-acetyltransferase [candidate division GN15 bacterium]|nr:GNAT family N-acetyltransferase [candidate division GN15 bacterium]